MKANLCLIDRVIRVGLGVVLVGVAVFVVKGMLGLIVALIGGVLIFSGFVGFCHVYKFLGGFSTAKRR